MSVFVKGYEFDDEKIGKTFNFDGLKETDKAIYVVTQVLRKVLPRDAYLDMAIATKHGTKDRTVSIIVLDDDSDEQTLKDRPLKPLHPDVEKIMKILSGPDVWKATWQLNSW